MNADTVTSLAMQALMVALKVSMPFLLAGLAVGLRGVGLPGGHVDPGADADVHPQDHRDRRGDRAGRPVDARQMLVYVHELYSTIPSMVGP